MQILPVILAGGSGTRLWPLSRQKFPKQFLPLTNDGLSLLQATLMRLRGLNANSPFLICNEDHRYLAAEQLRLIDCKDSRILLEPEGKNTAPAIALAAFYARQTGSDPVMLVLPADHLIDDVSEFHSVVQAGFELAETDRLVTFGVRPSKAETGYGYIEIGESLENSSAFSIRRFIEKPDKENATRFFEGGNFLWNSGMFIFKASTYLRELKKYSTSIYDCCHAAVQHIAGDQEFVHIDNDVFKRCPSDSIDYAVMEKTREAAVLPLDARWSDVGSWSALWEVRSKDVCSNVFHGDVISQNSTNNLVFAEDRLVTLLGVDNLVVVETKDAVLVANKDSAQNIKGVVDLLKQESREEYSAHREVVRPWGTYDSIDRGKRYQVKRIMVKPGAKLSVQMHHHRAEHWIIVKGTAKITNGGKTYLLTENQSTYIPVGEVHALENPGRVPLELIEVQSGSYLGEDDIVRFEDLYGRV